MNFPIVTSIQEKDWEGFVRAHPEGNIFQTPEMYRVFERAQGHRPQLYAAVNGENQVQALLLPVQVTLMNGVFRRLTTRAIAYGGCLGLPGPQGEAALDRLLGEYSRYAGRAALFTELRNLTDTTALQPVLQRSGFAYAEHLNYLIYLDCSPEQLLQNIGARTRKHIRQSLRRGDVTVEDIVDRNQLSVWYDLVRKTYTAAQVPLADRSLFEAAFDVLAPRGMIKFWLARVGPNYAAASAELLYKDVIYGWYGGMDRAYARALPGETLMWHILEWGAMSGYKTYDFGGAGKPGEEYGVRDFKAKFGGQLVCFGRNTKLHAPNLLKWSERGYQVYRYLFRHF
jgi:lipid II:glycine glycyltransferase (peptidoglycan interpeptide bridge formation enzyme)